MKNKKPVVTLGGFDVLRLVHKKDEKVIPSNKAFILTEEEKKNSNICKNEMRQLKEKIFE